MKRILLAMLVGLSLICNPCFAKMEETHVLLKDSSGTVFTDYALTSGAAVYSETLNLKKNAGFVAIRITEDKSGGTGDVDVSAEYSVDGVLWDTVYTSNMNGTITAEGNIMTALQNVRRRINHTTNITTYMRYKFDPDADSQITVFFIYLQDR